MKKLKQNQTTYKSLISGISNLLDQARHYSVQQFNTILVNTYRTIGKQIVEFEQKGKERAKYGIGLLKKISKDLIKQFGKGFSVQNIERMRSFYHMYPNSSTVLRNSFKLSWSHYLRLMTIKNKDERNFYEIECVQNNRSLRELNRQFDSALFERLMLSKSKSKNKVRKLSRRGQIIEKIEDVIKDPYYLEFLGLKSESIYSELQIETAIIDKLSDFLLELGKGFTFVGRQQKITSGPKHRYIDLVFYNRLLKCFVLIDLKVGKLTHQDIGQMRMYINYYDKKIKSKEEKPTIGLVLCKENDEFIVEYTIQEKNKNIFAREYRLYLPNKKQLQHYLTKLN